MIETLAKRPSGLAAGDDVGGGALTHPELHRRRAGTPRPRCRSTRSGSVRRACGNPRRVQAAEIEVGFMYAPRVHSSEPQSDS